MASPYIGQISMFGFNYAPAYWAFCDGSTVPMNQYSTLFSLIGTTFGGNGSTTVGLPNLSGASPCGTGTGPGMTTRTLGQSFGTATVTLDQTTMPAHTHAADANSAGFSSTPIAVPTMLSALTNSVGTDAYSNGAANIVMETGAVTPAGNGLPHNNQQPYLALNYCIALMGEYPYFD